jgi:uncharacterized protein (DUF983 family)
MGGFVPKLCLSFCFGVVMAKQTIEIPVWQVVAVAVAVVLIVAGALRRCDGGTPVFGAGPLPQ